MKIKFATSSVVALAALCGTLQSFAQNETDPEHSRDRDEYQTRGNSLGQMQKARSIIGLELKDPDGQSLGEIKDLAVDLSSGRIVEIILQTGGFLGMGDRFVAVPPGLLSRDTVTTSLRLDVDQAKFKSAPAFSFSKWETNADQDRVAQTYQYYNVKPYFARDDQSNSSNSTASNRLGAVQSASKLMGTTVRNLENEKVGKLENLIVDLPAGRVVEVILASGGFLGMGDELSAVPPQSLRQSVIANTLVLDTTREALAKSPHFKSREWSDVNNPGYAVMVYRAYNVSPYFATNAADNTAQNVRDRSDTAVTPLSQGNSDADVEVTRQIRKQIMAADGLSFDARNVKVITTNGHVTLRGPVDSADEKRQIAAIAAQAAPSSNVDNQLQVKNDASTTSSVNNK